MAEQTNPAHLVVTLRSGDDHLIDASGQLVNLDRQRREAQRAEDAKAAKAAKTSKSTKRTKSTKTAPADPLDHDGDGRKGGMKGVQPRAARTPPPASTDQA